MKKRFFKKIIAQTPEDLRLIAALCSDSLTVSNKIKYLKDNKIFLIPIERPLNELGKKNKKIESILKFEYIEKSKSKNIIQDNDNKILKLITIDIFKKNNNFEISLLFSDNAAINLETEIIEATLEDFKKANDENN
ncbi:DUF2948 family protein [Candidatus Pelagibacter sp.]|nr:DUF2948 family protein [Candidatus Pelagibacter sp.]